MPTSKPESVVPFVPPAAPAPVEFKYGGEVFVLPTSLDLRAVAALEQGRIGRALTLALGKEQADRLIGLDTDEPFSTEQLQRLFTEVAEAQGTTLGESEASTDS